ncbi:MAG TPA: glycosyltransferase [Candidatus Dojkabacteria bacterium]
MDKQTRINKKYSVEYSLIVSAYQCADSIKNSLEDLIKESSKIGIDIEIIVVVDGQDYRIVEESKKVDFKNLTIIHYEENRGKGFAVKIGMEHSQGQFVGYVDGGTDIEPESVVLAMKEISKSGVDIVCGSKKHPQSIVTNYSRLRQFFTFGYNRLVQLLLGINYKDTQVGLKFYSRDLVDAILPKLIVSRFAFEAEFLAVADLIGFKNHKDVPVNIIFRDRSSATTMYAIYEMFMDTLMIFYRLRIQKYYKQKKSHSSKSKLNMKFL